MIRGVGETCGGHAVDQVVERGDAVHEGPEGEEGGRADKDTKMQSVLADREHSGAQGKVLLMVRASNHPY